MHPTTHGDIVALKKDLKIKRMSEREPRTLEIEIPLNLHPDSTWIGIFMSPRDYVPSFHPKQVTLIGDKMSFPTDEQRAENDLKSIYKYIDQANDSYKKHMADMVKQQATQAEREGKAQQKIKELTEKLRNV